MKTRKYYILAVREDGRWGVQFGDYDRKVVVDEQLEYWDKGYRRRDTMIVETMDGQHAIDVAIALLNKE